MGRETDAPSSDHAEGQDISFQHSDLSTPDSLEEAAWATVEYRPRVSILGQANDKHNTLDLNKH